MVDREKVISILRKRFPGASIADMAAAVNAIVGLGDEWREVESFEAELECHLRTCVCEDPAWFVRRFGEGRRFKLLEHHEG